MPNRHIPRPNVWFHARWNNLVTYVNGQPADLGPAVVAVVRHSAAQAPIPKRPNGAELVCTCAFPSA